jgi:alkanesulfonate monooxygenase SsuD/methylene tetrahydromethanopterin reductase-like flavin-dependent oxidoreductase (luciferase family)
MLIHLNAFTQCSVGLQSFGQWRNPHDRTPRGYKDVRFWTEIAQTLERGCFDSLFFADVHGVYAETEAEARAKEQRLRSYASPEGAFALYGGWTGVDLAQLRDDDVLENFPSEGIQNVARWFAKLDPTRVWTLAEVGEAMKLAGMAVVIAGDPGQVADELERWVDEGGVDGFNLVPIEQPGSHTDFVDLIVPELQRRGRMRTTYEGTTLREHFFGKGQCRLVADHIGGRYRR